MLHIVTPTNVHKNNSIYVYMNELGIYVTSNIGFSTYTIFTLTNMNKLVKCCDLHAESKT